MEMCSSAYGTYSTICRVTEALLNVNKTVYKRSQLYPPHASRLELYHARCYFPSAANEKVSKREAIFHPPWTEKKHADAIFCLCGRKNKQALGYFPSTTN